MLRSRGDFVYFGAQKVDPQVIRASLRSEGIGSGYDILKLDVTNDSSITKAVAQMKKAHGEVDGESRASSY